MGKLAVGIISLLVGLIVGAIGALTVGGGAMAGVGIATGLSSGVCMTVEAAENLGLLTDEQVDQVLARAVENLNAAVELPESGDTKVVGSAAECREFMDRLRAAK